MDKEQIRDLANGFAKMYLRYDDGSEVEKRKIVLSQTEDGWDLNAVYAPIHRTKEVKLVLDFPLLPLDRTEAAIEIAGYLSQRLGNYFRIKKANEGRSKESRSALAKKAVETRWKNRDEDDLDF